MNGPKVESLP